MKTMSFLTRGLVTVFAGLVLTACASTLDEIRALEAKKETPAQQEQQVAADPHPHSPARHYSLPDSGTGNALQALEAAGVTRWPGFAGRGLLRLKP